MNQLRNVTGIFLSKVLGVLIFLVILGLLNFLIPYVEGVLFSEIVGFLNANVLLILLFALFFCVAEMFFALVFPLNLPAPLFSSFGSVFLVSFIFNVLGFLDSSFNMGLKGLLNEVYFFIIVVVFLVVFISGYAIVFGRGVRGRWVLRRRGRRVSSRDKLRYVQKNGWDREDVDEDDEGGKKGGGEKEGKKEFKKIPSKKASLKEVRREVRKKK